MNEQLIERAMGASPEGRGIQTVTAEILAIRQQTQLVILSSCIEIGRRLCEAKELVPFGRWGDYLKQEVDFSVSTANNMMRIFREYGSEQVSLFGEAKSQSIANLTYSKAVALFALPEEERENFLEEHDVGDMSVSDLKRQLAEREQELAAAKANARAALEQIGAAKGEVETLKMAHALETLQANKTIAELEASLDAPTQPDEETLARLRAEQEEQLRRELDAAQQQTAQALADAKMRAEALTKQLCDAQNKAKQEQDAALAQSRKTIAALEAQLAEAQNGSPAESDELTALQQRAAELERQLRLSDSDAARFSVHFEAWQERFETMLELLEQMPETSAPKLRRAVEAALGGMGERVMDYD